MATPLGLETPATLTWSHRVIDRIRELAATGQPFTFDDLHTEQVGEPANRFEWGAVTKHPSIRGLIEPIGYTKSERTGGLLHIWQGKQNGKEDV